MRRYYERLPVFPECFVVLGYAIASFNPVEGGTWVKTALRAEADMRGVRWCERDPKFGHGKPATGSGGYPGADFAQTWRWARLTPN